MESDKNIYLIGPRACGKTSVGRLLAEQLGKEFVDIDHVLVRDVGMDIAEYVERFGWDAFRDREVETLLKVARTGGLVVGCGGGIVLREENHTPLREGLVLYLKAAPEELARRLTADPNAKQRPSLTGQSIVDEVSEVLRQRSHLYEDLSHYHVSGKTLDESVARAVELINTFFERF